MTCGNLGGEPIVYRRRRRAGAARTARRRVAAARPADPRAVRRLGRPGRRRRGAAGPPLARVRTAAGRPAGRGAGRPWRWARDLKNTCAVAEGRYAWLSQHVGDMDDLATLRAFDATVAHLSALTQVAPDRPRRRRAPRLPLLRLGPRARAGTRPLRTVQHHHAHIAAVMAEHGPAGRRPGDRGRLRRHRVRHRRRGLGRRGAARRLQGVHPGRAPGLRAAGRRRRQRPPALPDGPRAPASRRRGWAPDLPCGARLPRRRAAGAAAPAAHRAGLRADLEHGPALRRGLVAGRRAPRRRLRGPGGDRAGGAVARGQDDCGGVPVRASGRRDPRVADAARWCAPSSRTCARACRPRWSRARFHAAVATLVVDLAAALPTATGLGTVALSGGVFANALLLSMTAEAAAGQRLHRAVPPARAAQRRRPGPRPGARRIRRLTERRRPCVWPYPAG